MRRIKLLAHALESAANPILITDCDGRILWLNDAMCEVSGFSSQEALGHTPRLFHSGLQDTEYYRSMWRTILSGRPWQGVIVDRRKDGTLYTVNQVITPLFDKAGAITHFLAIQHDISTNEQESAKTHWLAYHDALTGLPNRVLFLSMLEHAVMGAAATGRQFAVLFIDLDNFKTVNDTLGHATGDSLLTAAAERLRGAVRHSDMVARLGGDEFTVLIEEVESVEMVGGFADKLAKLLNQPYVLERRRVESGASIGISLYPTDGENSVQLLSAADQAMYRAKQIGLHSYCFFTS
jgi:diguanylate cyclase (GGDEF)-like protein/PAS domain S-box-containing protein